MDKLLRMDKDLDLAQKCKLLLNEEWTEVVRSFTENQLVEFIDNTNSARVRQILTSSTKSYHYVLPTQLLAKCVNNKLDARSLQAAFKTKGAFDARSIAHEVIVPFDKLNNNVLGGSNEPYVNNPLRYPAILSRYRNQQKNKEDWDLLVDMLAEIQLAKDVNFYKSFLRQVLLEIYKLLSGVVVIYPTPSRISLNRTIELTNKFVAEKSGGERLESIITALLRTIGTKFNLFDKIERAKVNASDTSTGLSSDIQCWQNDQIILAVEVKEKELTLTQFESTVQNARTNKISEILFVAEKGLARDENNEIQKKIGQEFVSGQNIYVINFVSLVVGVLILLGEKGRVEFLRNVGPELDRVDSSILHRKRWAELLRET